MSKWTEPSPSDFTRWEERLLDGEEPSSAAKQVGHTCSAFKRADAVRHREALEMSRETRAAYVDRKVEGWIGEDDPSDSIRLAWARRWNPAYRTDGRVEVTGPGGGPVEIEDRSATLADIARVLAAAGALDGLELAGGEVPAARELLAAPTDR